MNERDYSTNFFIIKPLWNKKRNYINYKNVICLFYFYPVESYNGEQLFEHAYLKRELLYLEFIYYETRFIIANGGHPIVYNNLL